MSAPSFKAKWLGDGDPAAQLIRIGDLTFVRGEAVTVKGDHASADMIRDNPTFAIDDAKAEPVKADEPTEEEQRARAEEGTQKAALRQQLRENGVTVQGNPSLETLRNKLVEATK